MAVFTPTITGLTSISVDNLILNSNSISAVNSSVEQINYSTLSSNEIPYSQDGTQLNSSSNVTMANAAGTAPDGTNTAVSMTPTGSGTSSHVSHFPQLSPVVVGVSLPMTYSVYVKGTGFIQLFTNTFHIGNGTVNIDLSDGSLTIASSLGSTGYAKSFDVGNGWYRVEIGRSATPSLTYYQGAYYIASVDSASASRGAVSSNTDVKYWWGAQFEKTWQNGSTISSSTGVTNAGPYVPTDGTRIALALAGVNRTASVADSVIRGASETTASSANADVVVNIGSTTTALLTSITTTSKVIPIDEVSGLPTSGTAVIGTSNVDLNLSASGTGNVKLANDEKLVFGDAGEHIVGDGTDLKIASSGAINIDAVSGSVNYSANGTGYLSLINSAGSTWIRNYGQDKDILLIGNDGGSAITALTLDMSEAGRAIFNSSIAMGTGTISNHSTGDITGVGKIVFGSNDANTNTRIFKNNNRLNIQEGTAGFRIIDPSSNTTLDIDADQNISIPNGTLTVGGTISMSGGQAIPGKIGGTNFTDSLLIGHSTTGTLSSAERNTGVGVGAMLSLTSGDRNTVMGRNTGRLISTGHDNILIGAATGQNISTAEENTAVGTESLLANSTSGHGNTAFGYQTLKLVASGDFNIGIGWKAGDALTNGKGNVIIGSNADVTSATGDRQLVIAGYDGTTTTTWISGDSSGNLTTVGDVTLANNKKVIFGDAGEHIVGDGTNLNIVSSNALGIDVPNGITLDSGSGGTTLRAGGGTTYGTLTSSSGDFSINQTTSDKDIIFTGNDGGSAITALTLDMSEAGSATFSSTVTAPNSNIIQWQSTIITASATVVANKGYFVNTTSNVVTITLPASAIVGDQIILNDYAGTWDNNVVTINRNGLKIQGGTDNLEYSTEFQSVHLVYSGATKGWIPLLNADVVFTATGGTITTSGNYTIHTFNSSGTFTPTISGSVEYLVVGGGGGGGGNTQNGNQNSGGGGAGGYRTGLLSVSGQAYTITVGAGGAGGVTSSTAPIVGGNSTFSSITSLGGGRGGWVNGAATAGGSGGGGAAGNVTGGAGTSGQGNAGGTSANHGASGGGGGGAGAVGQGLNVGIGGVGLSSSINGTATFRAGGGGGSMSNGGGAAGAGGNGGGGAGSSSNGNDGVNGTENTGGGGGGSYGGSSDGGAGGSGVVIIRYLT